MNDLGFWLLGARAALALGAPTVRLLCREGRGGSCSDSTDGGGQLFGQLKFMALKITGVSSLL